MWSRGCWCYTCLPPDQEATGFFSQQQQRSRLTNAPLCMYEPAPHCSSCFFSLSRGTTTPRRHAGTQLQKPGVGGVPRAEGGANAQPPGAVATPRSLAGWLAGSCAPGQAAAAAAAHPTCAGRTGCSRSCALAYTLVEAHTPMDPLQSSLARPQLHHTSSVRRRQQLLPGASR